MERFSEVITLKRKISLLLCVLMMTLLLTACGGDKETVSYDEVTLSQYSDNLINASNSSTPEDVEKYDEMTPNELEAYIKQYPETVAQQEIIASVQQELEAQKIDISKLSEEEQQGIQQQIQQMIAAKAEEYKLLATPESFVGMLAAWQSVAEECGSYVGHDDYEFEATAKEVTVTTEAEFTDRNAKIILIYDKHLKLKSLTVDGHYETGEILKKAGLNTVLGMGTVFSVLVFLWLFFSLFRFIPAIEAKFSKKKVAIKETDSEVAITPSFAGEACEEEAYSNEEELVDDLELVAVITAAIAASEGEAVLPEGFYVRSIKRRPSNKWKA
jgi:sodium pump decarboxylase gamma subunit